MADYIIVGLGNPGKDYVDTRHNVGFEMVDSIAAYADTKIKKAKCKALIGECRIGGKSVVLAKPQTFMNLSGESVVELLNFYKLTPKELIVIYDDISLDVGRLRIRGKGSAGGHNGIKNIIYLLKDDAFPRIKVGIGNPTIPLVDYVLQKFSKEQVTELIEIAKIMPDIVSCMIMEGIDKAMNKYN